MSSIDLKVNIAGVEFKNPVIAASGTFAFGREYSGFLDLNHIGGISVKGLTLEPRRGNRPPRIAETPGGILNSVGLQNPGVKAFISEELPFLKSHDTRIIANIAGNTADEYEAMVGLLNETAVDMIELNVSCPNVKAGCIAFGSTPSGISEITSRIKKVCRKPLMVKLTPNVTDIKEIALAAEASGADALSLINTVYGMAVDIRTRRPVLANNFGGLSGPAVKPVAIRMVYEAACAVDIPVVGMGGITTGEDAVEFLLAGARAVMVGTASFVNPAACADVAAGIEEYLKTNNYCNTREIVGKLELNG